MDTARLFSCQADNISALSGGVYGQRYHYHSSGSGPRAWGGLIWIGIAVAAAIILIVVLSVVFAMKNVKTTPPVSPYTPISHYDATLSPAQQALIKELVNVVAPALKGSQYDKTTIDGMIGNNPVFDQVMYFYFRQQLADGKLTIGRLSDAITKGMPK